MMNGYMYFPRGEAWSTWDVIEGGIKEEQETMMEDRCEERGR